MSALARKPSPGLMRPNPAPMLGIPRGNPAAMGNIGSALAQAVPGPMQQFQPQPGPPPPQVAQGGMPGGMAGQGAAGIAQGVGGMWGGMQNQGSAMIGAQMGQMAGGMPGMYGGGPGPMPGNVDPGYFQGAQPPQAPIHNGYQRVSAGLYKDPTGRIVRR